MKKNWTIFIIICVVCYIWMVTDSIQKRRAYEAELAAYQMRVEAFEAAKAEEEARKQARLKELARLHAERAAPQSAETTGAGRETGENPEAVAPSGAALEIGSMPATATEREMIALLGDPTQAPKHVIETALYKVVFSELGAVPISWEIKSSEFVRNIDEFSVEATTTTMQLVPQVGEPGERRYPLEIDGGRNLLEFNKLMWAGTMEQADGGTRLNLVSDPSPTLEGLSARKSFFFRNDSFVVDAEVTLENAADASRKRVGRDGGIGFGWQGGFGRPEVADRVHGRVQAIYASDGDIVTRSVGRGEPAAEITTDVEWAGQEKKFFAVFFIPGPTTPVDRVRVSLAENAGESFRLEGVLPPLDVVLFHPVNELGPGDRFAANYQIFVGPKSREALTDDAFAVANLDVIPSELVFHAMPLGMGFLRWLALVMLNLLRWLHEMTQVWGLAIIGTTLIVRVLIFPLTHWALKNQARTMVEQEKIRPELQEITKKYKKDPMKRNQAMMQLYAEHQINPVAGPLRGCLPALLQMPIFLALYVVFEQSVELRGQSFLWMNDLSAPDHFLYFGFSIPFIGPYLNILPIIMGFTNYGLMAIMRMPATDEMQERIQKQMTLFMPIMIVIFLYHMPSGLTLYWTVSNLFSIAQSLYTRKMMEGHKEKHRARLGIPASDEKGAAKRDTDKRDEKMAMESS